jgi:hypothetical protein
VGLVGWRILNGRMGCDDDVVMVVSFGVVVVFVDVGCGRWQIKVFSQIKVF